MTENQYDSNYREPASGYPEPPLRSDAGYGQPVYGTADAQGAQPYANPAAAEQAVQPAYQPAYAQPEQATPAVAAEPAQAVPADTSGVDAAGEIPATGVHVPIASSDATESFAAARSGDTDAMPKPLVADAAPVHEERTSAYVAYSPSAARAGASPQEAAPAAAYRPATSQAPRAERPAYAAAGAQAPGAQMPGAQAAGAKKQGGAGKTFLFGFLGALVACALALGGFALVNGGNARTQVSSAVIGTTDQSVINAVDEGHTLAEAVAAKALPSVVAIYNYQESSNMYGFGLGYGYGYGTEGGDSLEASGMGSGVVISDDGYIITNYHVVEDAAKLTVNVDGKERDATFVGGDQSSDIAVIKVEDTDGLVAADIGDSDSLVIGEWVMTVGAPLGLEQSVATGIVSATNRDTISSSSSDDPYSQLFGYGNSTSEYVYYPNMIQTDAVINPGNSGGALVDADGKLIGINSMLSSSSGNYAGVGFAIPINYAIGIAQDVIDGKTPTHAMLGVSLSQVNSTIAQRYNLSSDSGAYISAITPDSGAANSDLQVGDIITAVDGKAVTSTTDVTLDVRAHKVGDTVTVTVNRDGETVDVEVTLTSDENLAQTTSDDEGQQEQDGNGNGRGQNGNGNGRGQGNGYSQEDIERFMELFGF